MATASGSSTSAMISTRLALTWRRCDGGAAAGQRATNSQPGSVQKQRVGLHQVGADLAGEHEGDTKGGGRSG